VVNEGWGSGRGAIFGTGRHPRWTHVGVAALATLVVATAFGISAELVARQAPDATLRLRSVSVAQFQQLGIRLLATRPPPYCALSDAVDNRGWAQSGLGGCPISRQVAEKDAMAGTNVTVIESALGRATMPQNNSVGQNHLVWVVVVRGAGHRVPLAASCSALGPCPSGSMGGPRLLLLDGQTGALLYASWAGGGGTGWAPLPGQRAPLPARGGLGASA